jgi:hypothetical protein
LDLGVYRWDYATGADPLKPFAFTPTAGGATLVQLLPSFVWDMPFLGWTALTPYLGLAAGPAVYLASGDHAGGRSHESLVGLAAYLRPGVRADLAPNLRLALEAKLGLFRSRTVFLPQFALAWAP